MEEEQMRNINTAVWGYFKKFVQDKDSKQFQTSCHDLVQEIYKTGNNDMLRFCENIIICYVPIINGMMKCEKEMQQ